VCLYIWGEREREVRRGREGIEWRGGGERDTKSCDV
jgi:hypothetical protein